MKVPMVVRYEDGREVAVTAKNADFIAYERQFATSMGRFEQEITLERLQYLAWVRLHRDGLEPRTFDEFVDAVDDVESVADEEPANPTQTAPTPEPSAL